MKSGLFRWQFYFSFFLIMLIQLSTFLAHGNSQCSADDMRQAMLFLSDFMKCNGGDDTACEILNSSFSGKAKKVGGIAAAELVRNYAATRLLAVAAITDRDINLMSKDKIYIQSRKKNWGGAEIDRLIEQSQGNIKEAIAAQTKEVERLKSLRSQPASPRALNDLEVQLKKAEITKRTLEYRAGEISNNQQKLKGAIEQFEARNKPVYRQMEAIDKKLGELELRSLMSDDIKTKVQLNAERKVFLAEKKSLGKELVRMETHQPEFVAEYNKSIDRQLDRINKLIAHDDAAALHLRSTKAYLEGQKLKPLDSWSSSTPQFEVTTEGNIIRAADHAAPSEKLPKWAMEGRKQAIRDFTKIMGRVAAIDPTAVENMARYRELLAQEEHERWRKWREQTLVKEYENRRATDPQKYPDQKFPIDKDFNMEPGKNLSPTQREALTKVRPSWTKDDVPWSQASSSQKVYTLDQTDRHLQDFRNLWNEAGEMKQSARYLISRPTLAKVASKAVRSGPILAAEVAMLWYDWNDIEEFGIQVGMSYPLTAGMIWDKVGPKCRVPENATLSSEVRPGTYAPWLCKCKDEVKKEADLTSMCRQIPSTLSAEDAEICNAIRMTGRNRDLVLAQLHKKLTDSKSIKANLLQAEVGCEVMMNYPGNCRFTTDSLTEQGLYFMNLIKKENLYTPVASLCPNVCEHWMKVAELKANEISRLNEVLSLPQETSTNRPPSSCERNCGSSDCSPQGQALGAAPGDLRQTLQYVKCQPVFDCKPDGQTIEIKLRNESRRLESYTLKYDNHERIPKEITMNGHWIESGTYKTRSQPFFKYIYDEGHLQQVLTYGYEDPKVRETIESSEILARFGEEALNANSNLVTTSEVPRRLLGLEVPKMQNSIEFSIGRRLEIEKIVRESVNFCCRFGHQCTEESKPNVSTPLGSKSIK